MIVFSFQPGVTLLGRAAAGALSCPGALSAQQISILSHGTESSLEMQPKTKSFLISLQVWAWMRKSGCWEVSSTRCSQPGPPQPIADQLNAVYFAALSLQGSGMYITSFSKPNNKHIRSRLSQVLEEFICKKL